MNASELRIGNWIISGGLHGGKILQVEQIGEKANLSDGHRVILFKGERVGDFVSDCRGIELTPALLEQCGFEKDAAKFYHLLIGKLSIVMPGDNGYKNGRLYFNSWCIMEETPKYLHTLQNLVYFLVGKELLVDIK